MRAPIGLSLTDQKQAKNNKNNLTIVFFWNWFESLFERKNKKKEENDFGKDETTEQGIIFPVFISHTHLQRRSPMASFGTNKILQRQKRKDVGR